MATAADMLADKVASIPSRATRTRAIYAQYSPVFERYHAGMPMGLLVASAQIESDGKMSSGGSASLGEIGILQVGSSTEENFGVPSGCRAGLECNLWLGASEYNVYAKRLQLEFPDLFPSASKDLWMAARLCFMIGTPTVFKVLKVARPTPGGVYAQMIAWAKATGAFVAGSQSATVVSYRIQLAPVIWAIGERSGLSMSFSEPWIAPPPANLTQWRVPKTVQGRIALSAPAFAFLPLALLAGAVYLSTR